MKRGTLVKINGACELTHLVGYKGVVIEKTTAEYFAVYLNDHRQRWSDSCIYFPIEQLDILEEPIEL